MTILDLVGHFVSFTGDLFLAIEGFFRPFAATSIFGYNFFWSVLSIWALGGLIAAFFSYVVNPSDDSEEGYD